MEHTMNTANNSIKKKSFSDVSNSIHKAKQRIKIQEAKLLAIRNLEQYDYKQPKINPYKHYTLSQVYAKLEKSTVKELRELIQAFDVECIDDLYELINKFFTLLEQ